MARVSDIVWKCHWMDLQYGCSSNGTHVILFLRPWFVWWRIPAVASACKVFHVSWQFLRTIGSWSAEMDSCVEGLSRRFEIISRASREKPAWQIEELQATPWRPHVLNFRWGGRPSRSSEPILTCFRMSSCVPEKLELWAKDERSHFKRLGD